jgi:hypothetical protein
MMAARNSGALVWGFVINRMTQAGSFLSEMLDLGARRWKKTSKLQS